MIMRWTTIRLDWYQLNVILSHVVYVLDTDLMNSSTLYIYFWVNSLCNFLFVYQSERLVDVVLGQLFV